MGEDLFPHRIFFFRLIDIEYIGANALDCYVIKCSDKTFIVPPSQYLQWQILDVMLGFPLLLLEDDPGL